MGGLRFRCLLGASALIVVSLATPVAAQSEAAATVTVVHAVPGEGGFPADVYLDGQLAVDSMVLDAVSEPIQVGAGVIELALFEAGADPTSAEPILSQPVTLDPGVSYTVVAQLIDDSPVMVLYVNDVEPVDTGVTRLTVRHTGDGGPLAVAVGGESLISDLMPPNEATVELPAGLHPLSVLTGDGTTLVEEELDFRAGSLLVLYAVGGTESDFGILTQQVIIPQVAPSGVPTGTGGLRAAGANVWLAVPVAFFLLAFLMLRPRRSSG